MQPLITTAQAKSWLQILDSQTQDDNLIAFLCSSASDFFLLLTDRQSITPATYTERLNGTGTGSLVPSNTPILSVTALSIDGRVIPASPAFGQPGYIFDETSITIAGGGTSFPWAPGGIPRAFSYGKGNCSITYTAGYAGTLVTGETFTVPAAAPFTYQLAQPGYQSGIAVAYVDGTVLSMVTGTPAAGEFAFDGVNTLTLAEADAGAAMTASYVVINIPPAIQQCVLEMVGWAYKNRDRIGITTQSFPAAGLNNTYSQAPLSPMSQLTVKKYRRKIIPWSWTIAWEIDIDGLKESFESRGDAVFARLRSEMQTQVVNLLSYVKDQKLSGQVLNQRTGNLKNSGFTEVEVAGSEIEGFVGFGKTAPYAVFQEQGATIPPVDGKLMVFEVAGKKVFTMKRAGFTLPARPFLGPSLDENREAITIAFQGAVDEEISK